MTAHTAWTIAALLAASVPAAARDLDAEARALIARFEGRYLGSFPGLFAGAPEMAEVAVWAAVKAVDLPAFGGPAVYVEMRRDGPTGRILRQRVFAFETDPARTRNWMVSYEPIDGAPYAGADRDPAKLRDLTPAAMRTYPPGCELHAFFEGSAFTLTAHRETCRIVTRASGQARFVGMRFVIDADRFTLTEQGFGEDGRFAFGMQQPAIYRRLAD